MERPVSSIPGLETLLRRRDLPNICKFRDPDHPILRFFLSETSSLISRSSPSLILNTFDALESPFLSRLRPFFRQVYSLGPLHQLLTSRDPSALDGGLREQDRSCLDWLDSQSPRSVVYVSFGSLIGLTRDQVLEFWHGLVNSGKPFLWALRPDAVAAGDNGRVPIPEEEEEEGLAAGERRGLVVGWAPQEEVLSHRAVGGFLTHAGWNSTVEAAAAGVPSAGWPQLVDQHVNSRCIGALWKIGLGMEDACDRSTVERTVRDLMGEGRREEMARTTAEIARMARECCGEGGSSSRNLAKLIDDIHEMHEIGRAHV